MLGSRDAVRVLGGLALGLCTWLAASTCLAIEDPSRAGRIIEDVLEASFPADADVRASTRDALVDEIGAISGRFGKGRPTYRRARRLHNLLHDRYLLRYDADADGFHGIVDDGSGDVFSRNGAGTRIRYDAVDFDVTWTVLF